VALSNGKSMPPPSDSLRRRKPPEASFDDNAPQTPPPNPSPAIAHAASQRSSQLSFEYMTGPNSPLAIPQPDEHVPSSETPSPMKLPVCPPLVSPAKISDEITRALQDNIASLLGKRPVPEQDPGVAAGGRAGKRLRPPSKTKVNEALFVLQCRVTLLILLQRPSCNGENLRKRRFEIEPPPQRLRHHWLVTQNSGILICRISCLWRST
jgi:hypothetical protein